MSKSKYRKTIIVLAFSCLWMQVSCSSPNWSENDLLRTFNFSTLQKKKISRYNFIFIIPNSGCSGCISNAESFFIEHQNQKSNKILFIFNRIISKKKFNIRFKSYTEGFSNVIVFDGIDSYPEIYPVILIKKQANINQHFVSPKEDGIKILVEELKKNQ